jgi:hypothetical protein
VADYRRFWNPRTVRREYDRSAQGGVMKSFSMVVAASLLAVTVVSAQARPDLSGTWVPDPSKSSGAGGGAVARVASGDATPTMAGGGGMSGGGGTVASGGTATVVRRPGGGGGAGGAVEMRVAQSPAGLTIERILGPVTQTYIHSFDGAENLNVNGQVTMRTRSRWEGNSLVTEGTTHVVTERGEMTTTLKRTRCGE